MPSDRFPIAQHSSQFPGEAESRTTRDGSTSLYSTRFRQFYHNHNGAETESRFVFFQPLNLLPDLVFGRSITIFEMGFGTGLNLLLLLDYMRRLESKSEVSFTSIEAYPASAEQLLEQNHAKRLGLESVWQPFLEGWAALKPGWNSWSIKIPGRPLTPPLSCKVYFGEASNALRESASSMTHRANYVFQDPFSPEVNPECWTPDFFQNLRKLVAKNATLRTYSASVSARMAMAVAGWFVAKAPGALGKREMTLASPDPIALQPYKRVNENKLIERYSGQKNP